MRWFSILLAVIVAGAVYFLVMEREAVLRFSGVEPGSGEAEQVASGASTDEMAELRKGAVSVVAMRSTAQVIDSAVLLRGRTEAVRQVQVMAETSGQIVSEPLRKGAMVEAGTLLCGIDPGIREAQLTEARARLASAQAGIPVAGARVIEAEARLSEAQINDNAAAKLIEGGYASETRVASTRAAVSSAEAGLQAARSGLDSASSTVEAAAAAVAAAEKEIERLRITAPFEGLLETDTAELGALMQLGAPCATVIQLDPMKLVGFVPEVQVDRITVGARAGAQLASGAEVTGQVTFLSRSADPLTRTFRVEIEVANSDLAIRDGQTADIAIASAGETAHVVPGSALTLDDTGALGVRTVQNDPTNGAVAAFVPVGFLRDAPEGVFVTGLPERAEIILIGQEYVTDGVPLNVTWREDMNQ